MQGRWTGRRGCKGEWWISFIIFFWFLGVIKWLYMCKRRGNEYTDCLSVFCMLVFILYYYLDLPYINITAYKHEHARNYANKHTHIHARVCVWYTYVNKNREKCTDVCAQTNFRMGALLRGRPPGEALSHGGRAGRGPLRLRQQCVSHLRLDGLTKLRLIAPIRDTHTDSPHEGGFVRGVGSLQVDARIRHSRRRQTEAALHRTRLWTDCKGDARVGLLWAGLCARNFER